MIKRALARLRRIRSMDADLKDRAAVERKLFAVYEGKREAPTPDECREWAIKLGVPRAYRMRDDQ